LSADQPSPDAAKVRVLLVEPTDGQPSYLRDLLDDHYELTLESRPMRAWDRLLMGHQADALLISTDGDPVQLRQLLAQVRNGKLETRVPIWTFTLGPEDRVRALATLGDPQRHLSGPHLLTRLKQALEPIAESASSPSAHAPLLPDPVVVESQSQQLEPAADPVVRNALPSEMDPVVLWLQNHAAGQTGKILFYGRVTWHLDNTSALARQSRFALTRQLLRQQDELLCQDPDQFWLLFDMKDELRATRVALRIAVALTRATDPGHFPLGIQLSGCFVNGSIDNAVQLCLRNQSVSSHAGQIQVDIDRWHFTLPIRVAQTLLQAH
jgi:hypothetical protein